MYFKRHHNVSKSTVFNKDNYNNMVIRENGDFYVVFFFPSGIFRSFCPGAVSALDIVCLTCSMKKNEERIYQSLQV